MPKYRLTSIFDVLFVLGLSKNYIINERSKAECLYFISRQSHKLSTLR